MGSLLVLYLKRLCHKRRTVMRNGNGEMVQSAIELFYKSICGADDAELVSHFPFSILILVFNFFLFFICCFELLFEHLLFYCFVLLSNL